MKVHNAAWFGIVIAACADSGSANQIAVHEANSLGITALEITNSVVGDDHIFELRGVDAAGSTIATVHRRIGRIDELSVIYGAPTLGAKVTISSGTHEDWVVTRDVHTNAIAPSSDPALQRFLALDEVGATLTREANIVPMPQRAHDEASYSGVWDCDPNLLNTSPTAGQCCQTDAYGVGYMMFFVYANPPSTRASTRWGPQTPCTSMSGGSCQGTDCYYGPNGFSRPSFGPSGSGVIYAYEDAPGSAQCQVDDGGFWSPEFYDVNGTQPTGQGCPGGNEGWGQWDY